MRCRNARLHAGIPPTTPFLPLTFRPTMNQIIVRSKSSLAASINLPRIFGPAPNRARSNGVLSLRMFLGREIRGVKSSREFSRPSPAPSDARNSFRGPPVLFPPPPPRVRDLASLGAKIIARDQRMRGGPWRSIINRQVAVAARDRPDGLEVPRDCLGANRKTSDSSSLPVFTRAKSRMGRSARER